MSESQDTDIIENAGEENRASTPATDVVEDGEATPIVVIDEDDLGRPTAAAAVIVVEEEEKNDKRGRLSRKNSSNSTTSSRASSRRTRERGGGGAAAAAIAKVINDDDDDAKTDPMVDLVNEDEALARMLQEEEERKGKRKRDDDDDDIVVVGEEGGGGAAAAAAAAGPVIVEKDERQRLEDDEAFARALAAEEERAEKARRTGKPVPAAAAAAADSATTTLEDEIAELITLFPDAEPNYIVERLLETTDPARVRIIADEMLETRKYPRKEKKPAVAEDETEIVRKRKKQRDLWLATLETNYDITEDQILPKFFGTKPAAAASADGDGGAAAEGGGRAVSETYEKWSVVVLSNLFPKTKVQTIRGALNENEGNLLLAKRHLELQLSVGSDKKAFVPMRAKRPIQQIPITSDETFEKDRWICENDREIATSIISKKNARLERERKAKEEGALITCACCYTDDVLLEDVAQCEVGHLFCRDCVRRAANEQMGLGRTRFPCLSSDEVCSAVFPVSELEKVLPESAMEAHWARVQAEELRLAELSDLEACPFCNFAVIMENKLDRELKCLNPACLKVSCRLCKEPSHIPLRCSEVEKTDEAHMRKYLENKLTEALCHTCWKCKRLFFKEEGCNCITCSVCKASQCYICKKPLTMANPHDHFRTSKCPLWSDSIKMNNDRVKEGGKAALDEYLEQHPEMTEVALKHNPLEVAKTTKKRRK